MAVGSVRNVNAPKVSVRRPAPVAIRDFNLGRSKRLPGWGEYLSTAVNDAKQEKIGALVDTELFGYGNQAIQTLKKLQGRLQGAH